jgi:beta-N-acetylhexosaminidase
MTAHTEGYGLLWIGFEGKDATQVEPGFMPGGLVFFARNLDPDPAAGPERCHALIRDLQHRWGRELLLPIAIDQEGGAVSRLKGWVGPTPSLRTIWMKGGVAACERWGRLWGRGLGLLGFSVDFAPVADLFDGNEGTGVGERAACEDPRETTRAAGAFLSGLETMGIRGCLKHFPGLGGTKVDSHQSLPVLRDMEQISKNRIPFRALAHRDRLVMVAHLCTPATDGKPASLHRGSVAANPWGIEGRWIPDDLEMGGCTDWSWDERVRLCLEAGHQALLACQTTAGIQACAEAVAKQPEGLVAPANRKFRELRANLPSVEKIKFDRKAWGAWLESMQRETGI